MQIAQFETPQLGSTRDHFDGDDYNLRLLIDRMERIGSSEREIEAAVRDASGCPPHSATPRWTREEWSR